VRTLRKVRLHGRGTEVAEGPTRYTVWPGLPPEGSPEHPSLAWMVEPGVVEGEPAWLESRPEGALLADLSGLSVPELGMLMLDVAEGLAELHEHGLCHGSVDERHILVTQGGRGVLIGAGVHPGSLDADSNGLRAVMLRQWPPPSEPPDPGEEPAAVVAETLAGWLAYEYPDHSTLALGTRAREAAPSMPDRAERIAWNAEVPDSLGWVDEDSIAIRTGPLDRWSTTSSHISGAITGALEGTQPIPHFLEDEPRRMLLLARLMSPPDAPPDPDRFDAVEGEPCQAIKALLAEEPLDPLPVPEGVLRRELDGVITARPTQPRPAALPPWQPPTDEVSQEEPLPEEVSPRAMQAVGYGLVLALCAAALVAWAILS
jgi:hypothetical protein